MSLKKFLVRVILSSVVIFCTNLAAVWAQEPDQGTEALQEEPAGVAPSGRLNLTFEQLGYSAGQLDDKVLRRAYRIYLPGNFQILPTDTYLDLVTSHTPTLPDKPSAVQLELNNRLVDTVVLTTTNAISSVTRFDLSGNLLRTGKNDIDIQLKIDGLTCEDPNALIEVLVDPTSTISFGYQQNSYPIDLALYPFPFIERSVLEIPVTMVLPDQPTSDDLSIAATVAAGLGRMSGASINLNTVTANNLSPEIQANHHLIVIGSPDNNSLLDQLELPLPITPETLSDPARGVLEEMVSPWNEFRVILVVSGLNNEGVTKASYALNRQTHFLGMRGPVAVILDVMPLSSAGISSLSSIRLDSLGYQDEVIYGLLPQEYEVEFNLPLGWRLEELPSFLLKFTHADILDPYESALDIKLNNVPIGSTLLDNSNANMGELTISLPGHLLRTGRNRLEIGVKMNLPDGGLCNSLGDERIWTVIRSDSEILLPYQVIDLPADLSLLPYPFSQDSGFNQTLLVLPDQPSSLTFDDLISLAVWLGSASRTEYIAPRVAYASEVDAATRENNHLILLGRPTENLLIAEINNNLPHPFVADSDLLQSLTVDTVSFLPEPGRDAGLLQIIPSPWSDPFSLLVVTGTTDNGVRVALESLLAQGNALKGNLAIIEPTSFDPASGEPDRIESYYVDTRPPVSSGGASGLGSGSSKEDLRLLAGRWWR